MMQMLILWCKYEFKLSNKADLPLKTRSWLLPLPNLELKFGFMKWSSRRPFQSKAGIVFYYTGIEQTEVKNNMLCYHLTWMETKIIF